MSSLTAALEGMGIYAITKAARNHGLDKPIDETTSEQGIANATVCQSRPSYTVYSSGPISVTVECMPILFPNFRSLYSIWL